MNFNSVTSLVIPEGEVASISIGGVTVWQKQGGNYQELYQRVEYIGSDGSGQYLDTGYMADNTTGLELTIMCLNYADVSCGGSSHSGTNPRFYVPYLMSSARQYTGWNTARATSASISSNTKIVTRLNWLNVRKSEVFAENGTEYTKASASFGTTKLNAQKSNIAIFCNSYGTGYASKRKMRLYFARISQGSDVVREFYPCRRISDGVLGVFETHTKKFFENLGGGTFACGADIDW